MKITDSLKNAAHSYAKVILDICEVKRKSQKQIVRCAFIAGYRYAHAVKPDNSLLDKVKCCKTCGYPGDGHFDSCARIPNRGDSV